MPLFIQNMRHSQCKSGIGIQTQKFKNKFDSQRTIISDNPIITEMGKYLAKVEATGLEPIVDVAIVETKRLHWMSSEKPLPKTLPPIDSDNWFDQLLEKAVPNLLSNCFGNFLYLGRIRISY